MTTNSLPTPAAWVAKNGKVCTTTPPDVTADEIAAFAPDLAPFAPLYRATDLPALVLPEVTDEDAYAAKCAARKPVSLVEECFDRSWRNAAQAVRDSLASRMRKPTLADVLPDMPELGEGEWVACDGDGECSERHGSELFFYDTHGDMSWCFVPADPDADAKAVLSDAWHRTSAEEPAEILDTLRAAGWELVRKEGER